MSDPQIILEFNQMLCSFHGEPFRATWPLGYATYIVKAWEKILAKEEFGAECEGNVENAAALLYAKPVCCRLTPEEMLGLYLQASIVDGFGNVRWCPFCKKQKAGQPVRTSNYWGRATTRPHICFECWLKGTFIDT